MRLYLNVFSLLFIALYAQGQTITADTSYYSSTVDAGVRKFYLHRVVLYDNGDETATKVCVGDSLALSSAVRAEIETDMRRLSQAAQMVAGERAVLKTATQKSLSLLATTGQNLLLENSTVVGSRLQQGSWTCGPRAGGAPAIEFRRNGGGLQWRIPTMSMTWRETEMPSISAITFSGYPTAGTRTTFYSTQANLHRWISADGTVLKRK